MEDSQFDVIIVGAGVMGSATAYQAAKRGLRTLLLEQFDFLHHRGSSHGESRTIRLTYPQHHYYPLVNESYKLWKEAQAQVGYQVYFEAHHLDMGQGDLPELRSLVHYCQKHRIPFQLLNRDQVAEKFSGSIDIPEDWVGLANEHGGVIKPTKAVAMFQALAYKYGAVLRDNAEVTDIKKKEGGVVVFTGSGEKFSGKKCVVTAGGWVSKLVKTVSGVELPIKPLETHVYYWRIKEGHEGKFAIGSGFPTFASPGKAFVYGTPTLEFPGLIKVAVHGGDPCDPDKRPWGPGIMMNELKEWIQKRFSGMVDSSAPVVKQSCMYSMTPDEDFVIDFLGGEFQNDVVIGGGFSGHGFKMAPVIGRILTEIAVDGETKGVDIKPFRIRRFQITSKI
ncbi:probable sarcosine oxidase [Abrus precatorius]|uniref:sarcosine oxidasee (formaldehyde-forming) n=1 Tax=Abrus precatorius TaxID=3816 RepID=A0A8B8LJD6_ABRPR|nr:probable sarcosine oxidase [Abrus precatorius]